METRLLLLMILCHVIDDFVLQPASLSNLKQKKFWWRDWNELYKHDYKMALFIHSISWSITILLPAIFLTQAGQTTLLIAFIVNASVHYIVDDLKANMGKINLVTDQTIHLIQVIVTWAAII